MRIRRSEETAAEKRDDYREYPGDTPDEPLLVAVPRAQGDYQYQYDVNDSSHMYLPSFVYPLGGVPPVSLLPRQLLLYHKFMNKYSINNRKDKAVFLVSVHHFTRRAVVPDAVEI